MTDQNYIVINSSEEENQQAALELLRGLLPDYTRCFLFSSLEESFTFLQDHSSKVELIFYESMDGAEQIRSSYPSIPLLDISDILIQPTIPLEGEISSRVPEVYLGMIGRGAEHQSLRTKIQKVARSQATCLIAGESGTGKELAARAIHLESERSGGPFIPVNSGAIPHELIESELFGYKKGAFTGAHQDRPGLVELANGGTLFLDEITETPPGFQVKLLRFLQEKTTRRIGSDISRSVDVRIIAATNRDPMLSVESGRLREDLYYRLNVVQIRIPPLRERKADIPALIRHFLDHFSSLESREIHSISGPALATLMNYDWPGNIRELKNLVHRMVLMTEKPYIGLSDLPEEVFRGPKIQKEPENEKPELRLAARFKESIILALEQTRGNKEKAAELLGISRATIYRKIKQFSL